MEETRAKKTKATMEKCAQRDLKSMGDDEVDTSWPRTERSGEKRSAPRVAAKVRSEKNRGSSARSARRRVKGNMGCGNTRRGSRSGDAKSADRSADQEKHSHLKAPSEQGEREKAQEELQCPTCEKIAGRKERSHSTRKDAQKKENVSQTCIHGSSAKSSLKSSKHPLTASRECGCVSSEESV
jgi:hypothetical protein